ncbi:MAG TPA: BrnT family toxin [Candidatus Saccharimonadales bacterium]|nr:BrnT family toxin [Candidatus Saccharimonadales bacterium]
MDFEWDSDKNKVNIVKHGLSFSKAQSAFSDKKRIVMLDVDHSVSEKRYFCIGKVADGRIATVRFTIRNSRIRIIGAGYWRKGKKRYEQR